MPHQHTLQWDILCWYNINISSGTNSRAENTEGKPLRRAPGRFLSLVWRTPCAVTPLQLLDGCPQLEEIILNEDQHLRYCDAINKLEHGSYNIIIGELNSHLTQHDGACQQSETACQQAEAPRPKRHASRERRRASRQRRRASRERRRASRQRRRASS